MLGHLPWMWDWTAAGWAAVAAWATVIIAGVAAIFAKHQVDLARKTREDQAQPFVVADFERSKAGRIFMDLVIRNTGTTIATNVKVVFDPPLESTLSSQTKFPLAEAPIITKGIPTLPPGREYRMLFEQMPDRHKSDLPRSYDAVVTFDDTFGKTHTMRYRLDLDIYYSHTNLEIYGEHDAAKALREIQSTLKSWSQRSGMRVWTRDEDAYIQEEQREFEERQREVAASDDPASDTDDEPADDVGESTT